MEIISHDSSKGDPLLLLHPEDSLFNGPWSRLRWGLVIDLGWAGSSQYADWSEKIGCPVRSLFSFANWQEDVPRMRRLCGIGTHRLLDAEGIDWWELLASSVYQQVYELLLLQKVAGGIQRPVLLRATRSHRLADALAKLLDAEVDSFVAQSERSASDRFSSFTRKLRNLTAAQIVQIAFDKWDTDYKVRRFFSGRRQSTGSRKRVLLPSAYRNVSRVLINYAAMLPDRNFLLVTTRADGNVQNLPAQVRASSLAAYAPRARNAATEREIQSLTQQLQLVKKELCEAHPTLRIAEGLFGGFARTLRNGLRVRDAWRLVLERNEIDSVLCADENNPYTRLPVLLAQRKGVHTVYCSHGALDCSILLRGLCSDTYLVKGEMEKDYLAAECGVPIERISVGAAVGSYFTPRDAADATHIVFFSEPYELYSGRVEMLYRDLLPRLCDLAREHHRKVIVKLHPFESLAGRSQLVDRILTENDRKLVEVVAGPFSEALLRKIWVGLTVESSVAVECALAAVPCFLCGWFDLDLYAYGKQYDKFGAAKILSCPADIARIPDLLESQCPGPEVRSRLYRPITREGLATVLRGKVPASLGQEVRGS